jgi:hypothetical protein
MRNRMCHINTHPLDEISEEIFEEDNTWMLAWRFARWKKPLPLYIAR